MWQTIQAQRVPSPHVEAPQRRRLNDSQLADLFNNATSPDACALAAKSFAENPGFLAGFLNDLPAEVPLVALCGRLASELAKAGVRDPSIWNDLLDSIRSGSQFGRTTPQQSLELLQGCARGLAS